MSYMVNLGHQDQTITDVFSTQSSTPPLTPSITTSLTNSLETKKTQERRSCKL